MYKRQEYVTVYLRNKIPIVVGPFKKLATLVVQMEYIIIFNIIIIIMEFYFPVFVNKN